MSAGLGPEEVEGGIQERRRGTGEGREEKGGQRSRQHDEMKKLFMSNRDQNRRMYKAKQFWTFGQITSRGSNSIHPRGPLENSSDRILKGKLSVS